MKRRINHILLVAIVCLTIVQVWSCTKPPLFTQYSDIDCLGWYNRDTLVFDMQECERNAHKTVEAGLRYTDNYKYRKLSLGIKIYEDERLAHTDTATFELYAESGKLEGYGAIYMELLQNVCPFTFRKGHTYKFKVYHIMRLDPIVGINNVMLTVE